MMPNFDPSNHECKLLRDALMMMEWKICLAVNRRLLQSVLLIPPSTEIVCTPDLEEMRRQRFLFTDPNAVYERYFAYLLEAEPATARAKMNEIFLDIKYACFLKDRSFNEGPIDDVNDVNSDATLQQLLSQMVSSLTQQAGGEVEVHVPVKLILTAIDSDHGLMDRMHKSIIGDYGGTHAALQIGLLVFDWDTSCICIPSALDFDRCVLALNLPMTSTAPDDVVAALRRVAAVVASYNKWFGYNIAATEPRLKASQVFTHPISEWDLKISQIEAALRMQNCHGFVNDLLAALNIDLPSSKLANKILRSLRTVTVPQSIFNCFSKDIIDNVFKSLDCSLDNASQDSIKYVHDKGSCALLQVVKPLFKDQQWLPAVQENLAREMIKDSGIYVKKRDAPAPAYYLVKEPGFLIEKGDRVILPMTHELMHMLQNTLSRVHADDPDVTKLLEAMSRAFLYSSRLFIRSANCGCFHVAANRVFAEACIGTGSAAFLKAFLDDSTASIDCPASLTETESATREALCKILAVDEVLLAGLSTKHAQEINSRYNVNLMSDISESAVDAYLALAEQCMNMDCDEFAGAVPADGAGVAAAATAERPAHEAAHSENGCNVS